MNHNQFKKYLDRLFSQSKYNYNIKKDTNQMSEIDFCVCLTEKDIGKYIKRIDILYITILQNPITSPQVAIDELYKKCSSEIVRYFNLTNTIIENLIKNLSNQIEDGEITFSHLKNYLKDDIIERINVKGDEIFGTINFNDKDDLVTVQQIKRIQEMFRNNEHVLSSEHINQQLKKTLLKETIEHLSYKEQKEMIETLIQNISQKRGIQNLPDSLFLPVEN